MVDKYVALNLGLSSGGALRCRVVVWSVGGRFQAGGCSPMRCRMKALMSSTRMMQGCLWKDVRMVCSCPLQGAKADDVPLRQITENNARSFCSQTMNHNVSYISVVTSVYRKLGWSLVHNR